MTPETTERFTGPNAFELPSTDSEALIARFLYDARFLTARAMHTAAERAAHLDQCVRERR